MDEKKLFLLDAYALIFRAYYALIRSPRFTSGGLNTSTMFGFVNTLQDVITHEHPTHMAVCFDPEGGTFRHQAYPEYKAGREATPEDIKKAIPYVKRIIEAYNIPVIEVPGFEADDVIGTLAKKAAAKGFDTFMMTPDKDFGQLVDAHVRIYRPSSGCAEVRGVTEVCEKFGIDTPAQVIDMLALMGDKVDNIPGCPGVGEVTAAKLIRQFGSVENLIENTAEIKGALRKKVEDNVEKIRFSKFLATIRTDVPVEFDEAQLQRKPINEAALRQVFAELEFKTLAQRILGDAPAQTDTPAPKPAKPAKPATGQMSFFSFDDEDDEADDSAVTDTPAVTAVPEQRTYRIADSAAQLIDTARSASLLGVMILADGDEAMTAQPVGVAVSPVRGSALYLPLNGRSIAELAPIFAADATAKIAGGDIKRDMVILARHGVKFSAEYFDTGVAHYLLQPDRAHTVERVAEEVLNIETPMAEAILGPKGKSRLDWAQVAPDVACNYACNMADMAAALVEPLTAAIATEGVTALLTDVEQPLVAVLADMELAGVRIDVDSLAAYSKQLTERVEILEKECFDLAGIKFNTASPAQVGDVLFDHLKIDQKAKRTKSGKYSTTEEVLIKLRDRHPLIDKILELRGIRKLLSTYVNALPELINADTGRIHSTFNQTITATGRLSSTNPNMQNIPVRNDDGREIRRAFIPQEGNLLLAADYSQIELRLVADMSGDPTMVGAFRDGNDIHAITAAKIYHCSLSDVTPDQRRKAKTANFGILYGISAFGLSERLQIPRAESKELIDGYFNTFPGVREYIDRCIEQARKDGYVTTQMGRRRMLPDINSRNAVVRGFSERNAVNAPIQGTAADIIKLAMVRIHRRMAAEGMKSKMILQVHDELIFDVLPAELQQLTAIVITEMESAYDGRVPLTVSHAAAPNWLEAH